MKFSRKKAFDLLPLLVSLTLEIIIYKWYATYRLVMTHVFMKFHEIIFIRLEVVVRTRKKAYLTFDLY